jgi:two-component system OmpR family response regulator
MAVWRCRHRDGTWVALARRIETDCNAYSRPGPAGSMLQTMETLPHLLLVDDDREIRELLARFLERHRFRVTAVRDGREARRSWANGHYQLVILDLMLPGESGLDLARWMRGQSDVPIVMLTAMGEETDRIIGLELGADDYVPKPFNPRELLARIRAVLRRAGEGHGSADLPGGQGSRDHGSRVLGFGGWSLDPARRRLLNPEGAEVALTAGEFDLLLALAERANRVLTRDMLLDLLRGRQAGPFDRAIDVAVSRLRRKLEDDGRNAQLIKTVRGGGYVLAASVERM